MTDEVAEGLSAGTAVGNWVIEEFIASGSFGVVYRARAPDERKVAIKVGKILSKSLNAQQLILHQNEIEALIRLKHPSLVEVLGYGFLEDGRSYLAMELVNGQLLKDFVAERGAVDTLEAIRIIRRIAEALAYCHQSKVLHLDLKPANIFVTDPFEPRIKVLDFGLARLSSGVRGTGTGMLAGTLSYMAPESFPDGGDPFTAKVDLYSLGIIFYELLAGHVPRGATGSMRAIIEAKRAGKLAPLAEVAPQVPQAVIGLIDALLEPDAARRLGSAALLATRLKALYYETLHGNRPSATELPIAASELGPDDVAFIGRATEAAFLREALAAVDRGESRAVVLTGEPGIGKSRLVSELLGSPAVRGMLVGNGRCRQLGELVPYSALREALGGLVTQLSDLPGAEGAALREPMGEALARDAAALVKLVPELSELLPKSAPAAGEGAIVKGMGAELVAHALVHFLSVLGKLRPVVLVIEDIHWADEGTLAVLSRLSGNSAPASLFLLCTGRPSARLPIIKELTFLPLAPLMPEENASLLKTLTGGADPAVIGSLLDAVPMLSTGNPLVCAQIVRDLQVENYLTRDRAGQIRISPKIKAEYRPPDSLYAVYERALDRVEPAAQRVLRVAARIDRQFRAADVAALGLFSTREVDSALETALRERLCTGIEEVFTFAHESLRESLARALPEDDVAHVHGRIAQRLEAVGASPGTLGYHLEQAGQTLDAAEAYLKAGQQSDDLHDPTGATAHLKRAFSLLITLPPSRARDNALVQAIHELVRVACLFGAAGDTLTYLEKGAALINSKTALQQLALHHAYARMYYAQANFPKAAEYSAKCLAIDAADPELRKYHYIASNIMGRALAGSGKFGPAVPILNEGYALAVEAGEYVEQTHTEGILSVALGYIGEFDKAREHAESASRIARRLGDAVRIAAGYFYFSTIAEAQCRWDEGAQHTGDLLAYAEEEGISGLYLVVGTIFAGRHHFHLGRLDGARLLLQHAINLCKQLGTQFGISWAWAFLGDVELVAQRMDAAKAAYGQGLALANAGSKDEYGAPMCLIGLAHHAVLTGGTLTQVKPLADEAIARLTQVSSWTALAIASQRCAEIFEQLGESDLSREHRDRWQAHRQRFDVPECEFWPRRPGTDVSGAARREYWRSDASRPVKQSVPLVDEAADTLLPERMKNEG